MTGSSRTAASTGSWIAGPSTIQAGIVLREDASREPAPTPRWGGAIVVSGSCDAAFATYEAIRFASARKPTAFATRVARTMLALAVLVSGTRTATAEPCAARAEVAGDAAAVMRVTAELARLGVEPGRPAPGCRGVVAQVELDRDGGIAVAIRDGSRRSEGRVVSDATVAASWIDSWLHDDLDGTSWLLASTPPTVVRASSPPGLVAPRAVVPDRPLLERFAVSVAYEQAWSDDGVSATGASAAGCLRVGRACIGGRARYSQEDDRTVNLTAMARGDVSAFATASVPFGVGRMIVAPEVGFGLGRTSTRRVESCKANVPPPMNCDPNDPMMDPTCNAPPTCVDANGTVFVGDGLDVATFTPRVAAGLRIAIPLFDHVWLDALGSLTFGPFGHSGAFSMQPDGTDPGTGMLDPFALPGESSTMLQLGIGLRLGAP